VRVLKATLTAGLVSGCLHEGLLVDSPRFDDSKVLFPESYAACNQGDADGCATLARQLAEWSSDRLLPAVVVLHRIACSRGVTASCVEAAIAVSPRDPSATPKLLRYCVSERQLAACDFLADHDSVEAARAGCELGSADACRALSRLWRLTRTTVQAQEFFGSLCSGRNAEACVQAGEWSLPKAPSDVGALLWFEKGCKAGNHAGCGHLADAVISEVVDGHPEEICRRFGESIGEACRQWLSACRPALFCNAVAGDDGARQRLEAACRDEAESRECSLFLRLPTAPPKSAPPH
jgi:hypothetical protein